jgi:hypothetical protein
MIGNNQFQNENVIRKEKKAQIQSKQSPECGSDGS